MNRSLTNSPDWRLMQSTWRKRFMNIEGRARRAVHQFSVRASGYGASLVPVSKAPEIFRTLHELRDEFNAAKAEFVENYDAIVADIRQTLEERGNENLTASALSKLPSRNTIEKMFQMYWAVMPIGGMHIPITDEQIEHLRLAVDQAALEEPEKARAIAAFNKLQEAATNPIVRYGEEEAEALVAEARQQMSQLTAQMVDDLARAPRERLAAAANTLFERLRTGERFSNRSLNEIREAFETIHNFSFMADDELLSRISECREEISRVTPAAINADRTTGAQLAQALEGLAAHASSACRLRQLHGSSTV